MKKHLLTLFSLLWLSTTITLAQMGSIVDDPTAHLKADRTMGRGFKLHVNDAIKSSEGELGYRLYLRSNALVMEQITGEFVGDVLVPRTTKLWSIPFTSPTKELEFTAQGELIVRGQNNQILFNAVPGHPAELLKLTQDGKLKIDSKDSNGKLYQLWSQ